MTDPTNHLIYHPYRAHAGIDAPLPAVYKASTVFFPSVAAMRMRDWKNKSGCTYGLRGTPSSSTLEERIATLEHGRHRALLPSGLAAVACASLALIQSGGDTTYGRNYGIGTRIGEEGPKPGYEQPLRYRVPSVAPSGLAFVTSDKYPSWKGSLLMGTLREQQLIRLTLDGRRISGEQRLLTDFGQRIRDVRQGPDGFVYLVTEGSPGRIWRLEP